jgi:hypothetical protein
MTARMRLPRLVLLLALGWMALASAAQAQTFPQQLGSFRSTGDFTNFEQRPNGAGLGVSMRYGRKDGAYATVFLYDLGRRRAPEGGANPDVQAELARSMSETGAAVSRGYYRAVTPVETDMLLTGNGRAPGIRCSNFRITNNDGRVTGESMCLTVLNGRFLKARVSLERSEDVQEATFAAIELMVEMQLQTGPGAGQGG